MTYGPPHTASALGTSYGLSGAHPRYARNPGTGEPLATASALAAARQAVYHDPGHPSAIVLPATT